MKQRNLLHVLSRMIQTIPSDAAVGETRLINDLKRQLDIASYTPPENMYVIWQSVQNIISERFKSYSDISTLPQWGVTLIQIWTDKLDIAE
jgi:hypothetical protein